MGESGGINKRNYYFMEQGLPTCVQWPFENIHPRRVHNLRWHIIAACYTFVGEPWKYYCVFYFVHTLVLDIGA